tara:strand:- start:79 stop:276 length:198 start_codon:yes stop_codon:yes gene_type:complete
MRAISVVGFFEHPARKDITAMEAIAQALIGEIFIGLGVRGLLLLGATAIWGGAGVVLFMARFLVL